MLCAHALCKEAGDHIDFVVAGKRREKFGVADVGFRKCIAVDAGTADADSVIYVGYLSDNIVIRVHRNNIMPLGNKT